MKKTRIAVWDVPFLLLVCVALGCASDGHPRGGSGVMSAGGRIGSLWLDHSRRKDVVAFAGRPGVETRGQAGGGAPYEALGYECTAKALRDVLPIKGDARGNGPHCRTAFYINSNTGRLETFFTTAPRYSESHGVRIGMAAATAERLLHTRRKVGCETDIYLYSPNATLTIAFIGGKTQPNSHVVGGRVFGFVLHSTRSDAGVFDCL